MDILFVEIVFSVVVVEVEVASAGYGDAREYDDAHDQDQTQQGEDEEFFRSFFHRMFLLSSGSDIRLMEVPLDRRKWNEFSFLYSNIFGELCL